jgi:ribosome-binding factor A
MSHRVEQINELLHREISNFISREGLLENGLITITYVKCSANLKNATVGISVLPENLAGTALKVLSRASGHLAKELNKKVRIQFIPKFRWEIDSLERNAIAIDRAIAELKNIED